MQPSRTVHTLHPVQLDVAGRRRAGDERQRAYRIQPAYPLGYTLHDLSTVDDTEVEVGYQGQRPATLRGTGVEHDRAGFGDRERAPGQYRAGADDVGQRRDPSRAVGDDRSGEPGE